MVFANVLFLAVITCSTLGRTVEGAVLSTASSSLYNRHTYFVCSPHLLAGPGKARGGQLVVVYLQF